MAMISSAIRTRFGHFLVRAGRHLLGADDRALSPVVSGPADADKRMVLDSRLKVVISHHAIERYGERTGREMGTHLQMTEIRRVWQHAAMTAVPPAWHRPPVDQASGTIYAEIADLLLPLVPYEGRQNTYVATTVLSRIGDRGAKRAAGSKKRKGRSGAKAKRRKWSQGGRPPLDAPTVER